VPLHPPVNLLRLYLAASHLEHERALVGLDELSLLSLSHDRLHLLRLDVLVVVPLADARSILPWPADASVSARRWGFSLSCTKKSNLLSFEAILLFDHLPHLWQR